MVPEPGGATGPPNIWQLSKPYLNRGGQIIPTYYYWPPQCFLPSGITEFYLFFVLETQIKVGGDTKAP